MPIRRPPNRPTRPGRSRRQQAAVVLVAVVALAGVAAFIGRDGSSSSTEARSTVGLGTGGGTGGDASQDGARSATSRVPASAPDGGEATPSGAATAYADRDGATAEQATPVAAAIGAPVTPKVVRTGSIEVEVGRHRFTEANARLQAVATGAGGFVSASESSSLDGEPRGSITLRVPAATFDEVVTRVSKLGTVRSSTTNSQDVTGEYSDVAARTRALEAERDQIGLVLTKAESIGDILSVRDRLSAVQGELEQLQGRQQVLDDQTSLSTLTVALSEKGATPIGIDRPQERRGLSAVWHDSIDRMGDGGRAIAVGSAAMLPWLLLALVLWFPARALWRRITAAPAAATLVAGPPAVTTAD